MNKEETVRTIIIDGVEITTSLSAVEIADLQQENKELRDKLDRINKKLLELPISKHSELIRLEVKKIIDGGK